MKKIYIINGVTGSIGSPLFTYLIKQKDTIVYGISRKGLSVENFIINNKLPEKHLVFSLGEYQSIDVKNIELFINAIPDAYEIIFIHTMGNFITELHKDRTYIDYADVDKEDGILKQVKSITYQVPICFLEKILTKKRKVSFFQFGSLSDKCELRAHKSWVSSMNLLKKQLKEYQEKYLNFRAIILNVSSVLIPKELIDRPFVTTQTDAELRYWLDPNDIAKYIYEHSKYFEHGFFERELYNSWPNFSEDHFRVEHYDKRRIRELFKEE